MIHFGEGICGNLAEASRREWLETNGLGGFASSTIIGLNTRRYHGLLVAALKPPVERYVLLSKLEETLVLGGESFDLSANRYPGVVHPQGFRFLKQFRLDPFPIFTYEIEGIRIEKAVFMVKGENSTVIQYRLGSKKRSQLQRKIELHLRPLIAFRDYHSTTHENGALNSALDSGPGQLSVSPYGGMPGLHLAHNGGELEKGNGWYRNFEYEAERERGLDYVEDLFNPCVLRFDLKSGLEATIIASTERRDAAKGNEYREGERSRRSEVQMRAAVENDFVKILTAAADQFIVARGEGRQVEQTVIAGYHWFSDWGRDTMIALPGLTLIPKRFEVARSILRSFSRCVDRGMLPNRFPDSGETPEYNTVDATLWFFEAIRAYLAYSGDLELIRKELYPVLADIVSWHVRGTRFGIRVDSDGLLSAGEAGVQLTWMDAKLGDWVVTPRRGKPVEIQALWYNALRVAEGLAARLGDEAGRELYGDMAALAKNSFTQIFWNAKLGCLYDVVEGDRCDASIRPNQIFVVSLPHTMLSADRERCVVDVVQKHLLTPFGLRTLSPHDSQYRGRYGGDPASRDGAYHQGTVWPWLMGPFLTAYIKTWGGEESARRQGEAWLRPFTDHLSNDGLGQISEVFDGDAPHRPGGCIAQAWSVGELLRAAMEDIRGIKPGNER